MNKEEYTDYCYGQLLQVFGNIQQGQNDALLKHRTEGLLQAGKLLALFSPKEAAKLMDKAHLEVFGQTIEGRKAHKELVKNALNDDSSGFFDIPAYERRKPTNMTK